MYVFGVRTTLQRVVVRHGHRLKLLLVPAARSVCNGRYDSKLTNVLVAIL